MSFQRRCSLLVFWGCFSGLAAVAGAAPIPVAEVQRTTPVEFDKEILPLLQRSCLACHSVSERQGALILESPEAMRKGGDSGPAIVPGKGAESLLLQVASHQTEPVMPPPNNKVNAPALSSQELGLLRLWINQGARGGGSLADLSPRQWKALPTSFGPVLSVAASSDGQYVAASRGNRLYLYHAPSGQLITQLADPALASGVEPGAQPAHRDLVESLAFNVDGDLLASGSFREVKIWRRPRDVQLARITAGSPVTALAVSPTEDWIATAGTDHTIRLWQATQGQPGPVLSGHTDRITSLRFTADGASLLSASLDQSVRRWRVADGAGQGVVEAPSPLNALELVATSAPDAQPPTEPLVVTGGADNLLRTWSLPRANPEKLTAFPANATRTQVSRDRRFAASADTGGLIHVVKRQDDGTWAKFGESKLERGPATAVEFLASSTPTDPPHLLTGNADGSLSLWKLPEFTLLRRWRGATTSVASLASSTDGRFLASGHENGLLSLWKLDLGQPVKVLGEPGRLNVTAVAQHPARRLVALAGTAAGQQIVLLHQLESGQLVSLPTGHGGPIRAVAFSPDGARLATGGDDQTTRLWDLSPAQPVELKSFSGQGAAVVAVSVSPDQAQLLTAGADHKLHLWNVATGESLRELAGHAAKIVNAGFAAGNQLYSISADRNVRFWNPADGQAVRAFELPSPAVAAVSSPDGQRFAIASEDKLVRLYLSASGQLLQTCTAHSTPAVGLSFASDGKRLLSQSPVGNGSEAGLWDVETGRLLEFLEEPTAGHAFLDAQTERWVLADVQGRLWSQSIAFWRQLEGNTQAISALAFAGNSQVLFAASRDGSLRGYAPENGQPTFQTNHGAPIHALAVAPNDQYFTTGGENGTVRFWQTNGGGFGVQQVANLPGKVTAVGVSADNLHVVAGVAAERPFATVIDPASGALLQRFTAHTQTLNGICLLEEGRLLTVSADAAWHWSIHARRQIPGHGGPVTSLAALPSTPQQVLSGSTDTTIRRWNLENGQVQAQYGHGAPVLGVAVRGDGQRLASVSENRTIKLWNTNGQQIAELRGDVRRRTAVSQLTQQQTAATERVNQVKQQVDAAEKDVPVKADAAQKATAALAAAKTDLQQKQAALMQASEQKIAAEKASITASAEARKMQLAKLMAEKKVKELESDLQVAQQRASQRTAAANALPNDAALKQAAAEAQQQIAATQQTMQQAQQALQAANQASQTAANSANEAAQKVTQTQKPFNDALAAVKTSESTQRLATQQHEIAARELSAAQARVPVVKEVQTKAEQALADIKQRLEEANKAATDAELPVRWAAFSPDGRLLATAGEFTSGHIWDAETGAPLGAFAGHQQPLSGIAFLGRQRLVTGSADQTGIVWDLSPPWTLERTIGAVDQPNLISHRAMSVDFSSDSTRLLVGSGVPSRNGELHVFTLADGTRTVYLPQAHDDVVHSARFSPDGKRIASGGADKYLRTFDLATGQLLRRFEGHTNYVLGLAWKSDGQTLVSAGADQAIKVWDAETADQRLSIANFGKHVTGVRFIGATDNIVSSCGDRQIRMHVAGNGGNFRNFGGANAWLHCVDVTPNNELVVAGTADGAMLLWNGNNGQMVKTIRVGE